ncbi:MAG: SDR family oxidoreductase [Alphaproteobacteria bacterium]|nr:SDR family oxidoreductase [Alphaproteobacteria bacterium]
MRRRTLLAGMAVLGVGGGKAHAAGAWVLVAGATGRTGRPMIGILKSKGFKVRAMVRESPADDLGADETVVADATKPETLAAAMKGITYVVSALGRGRGNSGDVDDAGIVNLTNAAKAAGAKQLVLMSSIGAEITSPTDTSVRRPEIMLAKGRGEAYLRRSGLPYTIVRPGGLEDCDHGKSGLKIGMMTVVEFQAGGRPVICRADVALVMVEALGNKDAIGKTFTLVGDTSAPVDAWRATLAAMKRD